MTFEDSICRKVNENLALLLLEPGSAPAELRAHSGECRGCQEELAQMQGTMRLLDSWAAPEPTPFFDGRLRARLREEQRSAPAGLLEQLRTRLLFGSRMQLRPLAAGVLALALVIGGGAYAGLVDAHHSVQMQTSATVRDLQSLDENAQLFQQLSQLDQDDNTDSGAAGNDL